MAEFRMTYNALEQFVDSLGKSEIGKDDEYPDEETYKYCRSIFLAALTVSESDEEIRKKEAESSFKLWQNWENAANQAYIGSEPCYISDAALEIIKMITPHGLSFCAGLIALKTGNPIVALTVTELVGSASEIIVYLVDIIKSAKNLEGNDFCVFNYAIKTFAKKKGRTTEFTAEDLLEELPENNRSCSVYDYNVACNEVYSYSKCIIKNNEKRLQIIKESLGSLEKQHRIKKIPKGDVDYYRLLGSMV